jgi:hypothetical protein
MHWTKRLQKAIRQAANQSDVVAPTNVRSEINVGTSNSTSAASSTQDVEINQTRGSSSSQRARRDG